MRKMSVALYVFSFISLMGTSNTAGEKCKVYQVPIRGKALRGHTYKTAISGELFRCYVRCERDPVCKGCNFKHTQQICEMNNETKETKPNDFITEQQSYYTFCCSFTQNIQSFTSTVETITQIYIH